MNNYEFLFPFEKIPMKSNILIYGAGIIGQEYLRQIMITNYCHVVGFIDRNYRRYPKMVIPIYSPKEIQNLRYDYVVIAIRNDIALKEIEGILKENKVSKDIVVYIGQRSSEVIDLICENRNIWDGKFAFVKSELSIAIRMIGAFGDCIIRKRFVDELIRIIPGCQVDIYHSRATEYLLPIYEKNEHINCLIDDAGSMYHRYMPKYALALSIRDYPEVDIFTDDVFSKYNININKHIDGLKEYANEEKLGTMIPHGINFIRQIYKGNNCYTSFSCGGIFDIYDKDVYIPMLETGKKEFEKLGLQQYITVNYGNGDSINELAIAKQWPYQYFNETIKLFKEAYPDIQVVQLGAENAKHINCVDKYVLGESFELVKYILKYARFHLDIEGGLVHLASQLKTKCIVLFGPTQVEYFGYDNNINIVSDECYGCCGLYSNINKCARDMERPICMYSIKPERVMEEMKKLIKNHKIE